MNYAYEIRRQAEAAPRAALPAVASALWKAFGEGHLSEADAEALSGLIEARQLTERPADLSQRPTGSPRKAVGSRPRTDASMERRRRWAASGRLPPAIAARFTLAEQAVLAVIAVEVAKRGRCALAIGAVASLAGVSETSVRRALREARTLGLITVDERRLSRFRNDTNLITVVDQAWAAWLRLARRSTGVGGGCQTRQGTNTPVPYPVNSERRNGRKGFRRMEDETNNSGQMSRFAVLPHSRHNCVREVTSI
ncbi:helix-turn-helix domain-containing protein [Methylobacterium sp. WL103]|uniref:helix-turn-helix domain-containing protein n=1 Tax=Methylobacterium sp. WL103 TaxID=2603891 RepID=UPI0011C7D748|nr:helix-turn-helix domain-containing protein [Methylobacterium sp. WL103]TXN05813.1 helix-turn-helix domain-containing protein [Methylobacterium sp. WL103]